MQEIVKRILEEDFHYDSGSLHFSCKKIELALHPGDIYRGSFQVTSSEGAAHGYITTTDLRMECLTPEFTKEQEDIAFCFHADCMEEGDVVKGAFSIVSSQGEYYLPFVVSIEHTVLQSSIGPVKNLFHFANLAKSNWQEALQLFYSPEFLTIFTGNDAQFYEYYCGLSVCTGNEQNMEEFLILVNKKQRVDFLLDRDELVIDSGSWNREDEGMETSLCIRRCGWGYTRLRVECSGDFLSVGKEKITEADFWEDAFELPVSITRKHCHGGKNIGELRLYNCYTSFRIPVVVTMGQKALFGENTAEKKRMIVRLMHCYQLFRMKKITVSVWQKETKRLLGEWPHKDDQSIALRLFGVQLMITEGNREEAGRQLGYLEKELTDAGMVTGFLWAYYLYLTTLLRKEEDYINRVTAEVLQLYYKDNTAWRVAWLLCYLPCEYNQSPSDKWELLQRQFAHGSRSPVIYAEALNLLNANPTLLHKLDGFALQVLYYGVRKENLGEQTIEKLLYHTKREKEYSPLLYRLLKRLYAQKPQKSILQEICTHLVKGARTGREYFAWYQKGVEAQLRITNLYEYYMASVDLNQVQEIPKTVLLYFSYQHNLDYEHSAFLYDYVMQHKEEYRDLYEVYRPVIERFVLEQLQRGRISRYLARLYQELLTPVLVTNQTAESVQRIVFAHEIRVEKGRFSKVYVYQPGNLQPHEYPVQNKRAYVALYGTEYAIVFEDTLGNRFARNVEYTIEKLMRPGQYPRLLSHYIRDSVELDIYLSDHETIEGTPSPETLERILRLSKSEKVSEKIRRRMVNMLLRYYYEADDMQSLDQYLEELSGEELRAGERNGVLHYMVLRGKYDKAYEWLVKYTPYFADKKTLFRLSSERIQSQAMAEDEVLLAAALYVFRKGKYDHFIVDYLVHYYRGMTKDLRDIWKVAASLGVDCSGLSERILVQMLFSGAYVGEKMEIFHYYTSHSARPEIEEAFLAQCSYEYFVKERLTEEEIFQKIYEKHQKGERVQKVCKLAYIKYYAENAKEVPEKAQPVLEKFVREMLAAGISLNMFKSLKGMGYLTELLQDKTVVEYRLRPGARARIYYAILDENGEAQEYLSEYMKEAYGGVVSKEFVLFDGECLQYYIMEENATGEQLAESGSLQRNEVYSGMDTSKYNMINDMLLSKILQDYDTLDSMIKEYVMRERLNEVMFPLV